MDKPFVSVIVPVFNAEKYLPAAIDSVLGQSFGCWEMILVDDGSTDSSASLCDGAASRDKRIKSIHRKNGGLSAARNTGIDAASGQYLTFLDADDLFPSDALHSLLNALSLTNADIATGQMLPFTGEPPSITNKKNFSIEKMDVTEAVGRILYQKKGIDNSASGKLYSSSLWKHHRFREGTWYEDIDVFYRLFLENNASVALTDATVYLYRQHPSSYLHTFSLRRSDVLEVTRRMEHYFMHNHTELLQAARSRRLGANFNILLLILSNWKRLNPQEKQRASEIKKDIFKTVKKLRGDCLRNPRVRIKNRLGALLSYLFIR